MPTPTETEAGDDRTIRLVVHRAREHRGRRLVQVYEAARRRYAEQPPALPLHLSALVMPCFPGVLWRDAEAERSERPLRWVVDIAHDELRRFVWSFGEVETPWGLYVIGADGGLEFRSSARPRPRRDRPC